MKLTDFSLLVPETTNLTIEGEVDQALQLKTESEIKVWVDQDGTWINQGDVLIPVQADQIILEELIRRKEIPWLLLRIKGANLILQHAEPADWLPLSEPMEIGVDEKIANQLFKSSEIQRADVPLAVEWCKQHFLIDGEPARAAANRNSESNPDSWQLIGQGWRADLQRQARGGLTVNRVVQSSAKPDGWSLIEGDIRFVNESAVTLLLSEGQQAQLRQVVQTHGDYVKLWRRYSEQEWQRSLRQAADLGILKFTKVDEASQEGGAWRFYADPKEVERFASAWKSIESDGAIALEADEQRPDWQNARYQDLLKVDNRRRFRGRPKFESQTILIHVEGLVPPDAGYLYLSLSGDRAVQERRQKALVNIETSVRSLKLRYILQGASVPSPRLTKYEPLTKAARECFKDGSPTDSQSRAIKMALETPDIALVIGPPGTGKTQVIAALTKRLAEIVGQTNSQHQILITSFQHDAVENALDRSQVYDLPSVKIGRESEVDPIERWCQTQEEKLDAIVSSQDQKDGHAALLRTVHLSISTLRHGQLVIDEQIRILGQIDAALTELASKYQIYLPSLVRDDWQHYLNQLQTLDTFRQVQVNDEKKTQLLKKIRAIRVTAESFADDGPDRIRDALLEIKLTKAAIPDREIERLEDVELMESVSDSVAMELKELRDSWVDKFSDYRPPIIRHRVNDEGLRLIKAVADALADRLKATRYGVGGVLHRYRDSFQSHQARARLTVHEYAMVVGATCQQSASVSMASLKNLSGIGDSGISFDTVIIDEAARANPLDLFIPMSMAEKRVILVGDHRQLPHLLEPAVESELAETQSFTEEQGKALHDSLFERLWKQLKDREAIDGFPRVVMLDTQFRMHPTLGKFISEQFYESVGLAKLKPGKEAKDFPSDTTGYEGKVCAWINVPHTLGNTERRLGTSRSWTRNDEAQVVAKEAVRLLKSCDTNTTIGVITFYSAQRDLIFEHLAQVGVAEKDPETGGWRISADWRLTGSGEERFRVGTVDGFQGKEFDIVLLSIVRSNNDNIPAHTSNNLSQFEASANRKYGHLRLDNRMNVAMSRQRRLLIAIGDKQMAIGANAEIAVPALSSFLTLCGGPDGVVR